MDRIVDIATDGLHLSAHRGFLIVSQDGHLQKLLVFERLI